MRVPSKLTLPFGYTVKVKQVRRHKHLAGALGWWEDSTRTIYLNAALEPQHKVYILTHEMMHMLIDYQHWCLQRGYAGPAF